MTTQRKAEGGRRKEESAGDVPVPHASFSPQPSSLPPDAFTAFAPRLETYWFTCERVDPVGKTVRYAVRTKDDAQTVLGEIAWSHQHNVYALTLEPARHELVAKCLRDLGEICAYLNARQRRRTRQRQHASGGMSS